MNINPETDLDLEKLFLPAWAQEPASANRYAKFTGEDRPPDRRGEARRGPRPPRREGDRREAGRGRREGGFGRGPREERGAPRPRENREFREPLPLPEISLSLLPDERGVDSLARQIKMTGRAYPLFDIARIILQKPERFSVQFAVNKNAEGRPVQPLFLCALDDTLWLGEDEAVEHVLRSHFTTFYQAERTATEPPKGKYTFVAQCGMSGVILGPPNHHDYQNQLRKLHAERFSRMPFEVYKARVKIVRDDEVVKKWVEEQSWKTEFVCLNVPEALKLATRADVEQHFRATHKDTIIKPVEAHALIGTATRSMRCQGLSRLVRQVSEDQRRFPLQLATLLSQQFAARGLQFFKVNKTITHVSVARPNYLDLETTPVSEGVRRIVEYINAHPRCTRRRLMESLAPPPTVIPVTPPAVETGETAPPLADPGEAAPTQAAPVEPTPEQTAVIADLHWLIHQGHVIEFASGALDTAKKPAPRPPKPEAKPAPAPTETAPPADSAEAAAGDTGVVAEPATVAPAAAKESAASVEEPVPAPSPVAPEATPAAATDSQL